VVLSGNNASLFGIVGISCFRLKLFQVKPGKDRFKGISREDAIG